MIRYFIDGYGRKFKRVNGTLFMQSTYTFYPVRHVKLWRFSDYKGTLEEV